METKHNIPKHMKHNKRSSKKEMHRTKCLHQKTEKSYTNNLMTHLKAPVKQEQIISH